MTIRTFYRLAVWLPLALPRRVPLAYGYTPRPNAFFDEHGLRAARSRRVGQPIA